MSLLIFGAKYLYLFIAFGALGLFLFQPWRKKEKIFIFSVVYFPLTYLLGWLASLIYFNPRPFVVNHFQPLIAHVADNGFPSDHMLFSSALASLIFYYNKKWGLVAWVLAFLVGYSRVATGLHHWLDILGSAFIALLALVLVERYLQPRWRKTKLYQRLVQTR